MKKNPVTILIIFICFLSLVSASFAQTATELVTRAKIAIEKKDYAAAVTDLTAAINAEPNNAEAYAQRARANFLSDKSDAALADAEKSLALDGKNIDALNIRGRIKLYSKDYDAALADFSSAVSIKPDFIKALVNRGRTLSRKKDYVSAINDFSAALRIDANFLDAYYERAYAESESQMWNAAESDLGKAYELGERDTSLFNNLSYVQIKMKQYVWAAVNARLALESDPQNETAKTNLRIALAVIQKPFDGALAKEMIEQVAANNVKGAIDLMNQGAEVNATIYFEGREKMTPLQIAAMRNNFQLVRALVAVGANVNEQTANGRTPLHFAAAYSENYGDKNAVVKLLLKNGANVNLADNNGETPLIDAVMWDYVELTDLMIKAGANVNIKYKAGEITPLMTAVQSGSDETVRLIISGGGNPNAANNQGFTPLLYAVWKNGYGLTKAWLLLRAGARASDIPEGEITKNYTLSLEAVRRMAALPKDSTEAKLFDAVADNNAAELASLLAANNSVDKTLLNYLLMMSVRNDNVPVMQALVAKGADVNFQISDDSVLSVAKNSKKNAAVTYLANNTNTATEINTTAQDEAKIAELIDNAASATSFATAQVRKAMEQRDAGREKAIWCLSINEAANSANAALRYMKQAQTIFTLKYKARIQQAKEGSEQVLKETMSYGCPVSLQQ